MKGGVRFPVKYCRRCQCANVGGGICCARRVSGACKYYTFSLLRERCIKIFKYRLGRSWARAAHMRNTHRSLSLQRCLNLGRGESFLFSMKRLESVGAPYARISNSMLEEVSFVREGKQSAFSHARRPALCRVLCRLLCFCISSVTFILSVVFGWLLLLRVLFLLGVCTDSFDRFSGRRAPCLLSL